MYDIRLINSKSVYLSLDENHSSAAARIGGAVGERGRGLFHLEKVNNFFLFFGMQGQLARGAGQILGRNGGVLGGMSQLGDG